MSGTRGATRAAIAAALAAALLGLALTLPARAAERVIPELVPDVQLSDLAGKPQRLRDSGDRPRLYNFWATWCEPCRREIPLLNTLQREYAVDHLEVVGVAVDFRDSVQDFVKAHPLRYTLLVGEEDGIEAAQKFGMEMALPFSVFADGQNRIIAMKVGELHRDEARAILASMRALRTGQQTLPEARSQISAALKASAERRAAKANQAH